MTWYYLDWQLTRIKCIENTSDWLWKRDKPVGVFQLQGAIEPSMQSNYCETNEFHRISGVLNYLGVLNFDTHPYITYIFPVLSSPTRRNQSTKRGLYPLLGLVCFKFFSPWRTGLHQVGPCDLYKWSDLGPLYKWPITNGWGYGAPINNYIFTV